MSLLQWVWSLTRNFGSAADGLCLPALQQQMVSPASSSQERVLTLSVPQGRERHLTGSDIKKLTWPEYISLYEVRRIT